MCPQFGDVRSTPSSAVAPAELPAPWKRAQTLQERLGARQLNGLTNKQKGLLLQELISVDFEAALKFAQESKLPARTVIRALSCEQFKSRNPATFKMVGSILLENAACLDRKERALVQRLASGDDISLTDHPSRATRNLLAMCREHGRKLIPFLRFAAPTAHMIPEPVREATCLVSQVNKLFNGAFYGHDVVKKLSNRGIILEQGDRELIAANPQVPRALFDRITDNPIYGISSDFKLELERTCRIKLDRLVFQVQRQELIQQLGELLGVNAEAGKQVFSRATFVGGGTYLFKRGVFADQPHHINLPNGNTLLVSRAPDSTILLQSDPFGLHHTKLLSAELISKPLQGRNFIAYTYYEGKQLGWVARSTTTNGFGDRFEAILKADRTRYKGGGSDWYALRGKDPKTVDIVAIDTERPAATPRDIRLTRKSISIPDGYEKAYVTAVDSPTSPRLVAFDMRTSGAPIRIMLDGTEHRSLAAWSSVKNLEGEGLVALSDENGRHTLTIMQSSGEVKTLDVPEGSLESTDDKIVYLRTHQQPSKLIQIGLEGLAEKPAATNLPLAGAISQIFELDGSLYFVHGTREGKWALYSDSGERVSPFFQEMSVAYDADRSPTIIAQTAEGIFSFNPSFAKFKTDVDSPIDWSEIKKVSLVAAPLLTEGDPVRSIGYLLRAALKDPTAQNVAIICDIISRSFDPDRSTTGTKRHPKAVLLESAWDEVVSGLGETTTAIPPASPTQARLLTEVLHSNPELFPNRPGVMPGSLIETQQSLERAIPELRGKTGFSALPLSDLLARLKSPFTSKEGNAGAFQYPDTCQLKGGGRETIEDKTLLMTLSREHCGFLTAAVYFGYDTESRLYIKSSPRDLSQATTGDSTSATIVAPNNGSGEQTLPTPLHVPAENVKLIHDDGKHSPSALLPGKDGVSFCYTDAAAAELEYSFRIPETEPVVVPTQAAYAAMLKRDPLLQEACRPKVNLPLPLQLFADSIRHDDPLSQITKIQGYVANIMHYDLDNSIVSERKSVSALDEKLAIMAERLSEIRDSERLPRSKLLAGVCADAAEVSMLLCNEVGLAAGIGCGFQVDGRDVVKGNAHAICVVAMPSPDGKVRLIELDGTPEGSSLEARSLLSFIPRLRTRERHAVASSSSLNEPHSELQESCPHALFESTVMHVTKRDLLLMQGSTDYILYAGNKLPEDDLDTVVQRAVHASKLPSTDDTIASHDLLDLLSDVSRRLRMRSWPEEAIIKSLAHHAQGILSESARQVLQEYCHSLQSRKEQVS